MCVTEESDSSEKGLGPGRDSGRGDGDLIVSSNILTSSNSVLQDTEHDITNQNDTDIQADEQEPKADR